jgi:4-alpha-glucanotransferase
MLFERSSGVLLHVTSLPDGRLGPGARRFVDWLARAGQTWWQVLPLTPPDETGSPYQPLSAFASSPGLLERPTARVARQARQDFRERNAYWAEGWERFAGAGALDDQIRFDREWRALRGYAGERGVRLLGDVPIYVGRRSAEVDERPELFRRDAVAGAPPDALSTDGQLWGNPLFDWAALRRDGYRFWIERLRRNFDLVDATRIDHFRGFVSYWAVPRGARTAREGRWRRGPGRAVFDAVFAELGRLPLVAENLGVITAPVERLRRELGLPGMHVLEFGFEGGRANPHALPNHEKNGLVYTSTHDTDTAVGWWSSLTAEQRRRTGLDPAEPHWSLIGLALGSRARVAVLPLQDVLGLGSGARMNRPGTVRGNWRWRVDEQALTHALAERLHDATVGAGR